MNERPAESKKGGRGAADHSVSPPMTPTGPALAKGIPRRLAPFKEGRATKMADLPPTLTEIVTASARAASVPVAVILGPQKRRAVARHRMAGMAFAYADGRWGSPTIAHAFGRDHTTVLHAVARSPDLIAETAAIQAALAGRAG